MTREQELEMALLLWRESYERLVALMPARLKTSALVAGTFEPIHRVTVQLLPAPCNAIRVSRSVSGCEAIRRNPPSLETADELMRRTA